MIAHPKRAWMIGALVPLLILAAAVICFAVTLNRAFDFRINADDAGELILSSLLSKEHGIISKNWYYSTELRVLNTQLVFAPLFFFIRNWHAVRVIGAMILLLILIFSVLFMCHGMGMRRGALLIAALMCAPISLEYYQFVIERSYYIPHIATMFVTLGMMFRLCNKRRKRNRKHNCSLAGMDIKTIVFCMFSSLLAFGTGLGGPRLILLFYLPLFMTVAVLWAESVLSAIDHRTLPGGSAKFILEKPRWQLTNRATKRTAESTTESTGRKTGRKTDLPEQHNKAEAPVKDEKYRICVLYAFLSLCSAGIGYLINSRILSKIYHFTSYEEMSFIPFHFDRFLTTLTDFLGTFGWRTGTVSMATLLPNAFAGMLFAGSLFCAFKTVFARSQEGGRNRWARRCISLLYLISAFVLCCLFGFTDMAYLTRYNLPIAVVALPVIGSSLSGIYERGLNDLTPDISGCIVENQDSSRAGSVGETDSSMTGMIRNEDSSRTGIIMNEDSSRTGIVVEEDSSRTGVVVDEDSSYKEIDRDGDSLRTELQRENNRWELAWSAAGICACVIISVMLWKYSDVWNQPRSDKYLQAVDYLEQNQYGTVYASFWNGNLFTELSDGRIRSRAFTDNMEGAQDIDDYFAWLQVVNPEAPGEEERVAFVLTEDEVDHCKWKCNLREEDLVFCAENLRVYGFDNHDAMVSRFYGSYVYDFSDNAIFQTNASDTGSRRVLHPGGSSFGPYILLKRGSYRVEITGNGLDGAVSYCTSEAGSIQYKGKKNDLSSEGMQQKLTYVIDNDADVSDFEIIVQNPSSAEVQIDSIRFDRVTA